jgi:DNA primase
MSLWASKSQNRQISKKLNWGEVMGPTNPVNFDLDTVALMRETLDEAWARLRPQERAATLKSSLAVRILETAAQGECDPQRLLNAALSELAA